MWLLMMLQDVPSEPVIEVGLLIANLINSVLVVAGVQLLKKFVPILKGKNPVVLQIIAMAAGVAVPYASGLISDALGHPVDLSPLVQALNDCFQVVLLVALGSMAVVLTMRTVRRR